MARLLRRKPRILVLDDDVSVQRLVSAILRREGYRVDVVGSGRSAIEAIEAHDYSALVLDLMMPTEGGMTVIRHLKRRRPAMLEHVILLTATPDAVLKAISKDVFAVVKKPFERRALIETVARAA